MTKSIRWTLLGWYLAILAIVIGGLGATLYAHRRSSIRQQIDDDLRARASVIAGSLEWEEHDGFELEDRTQWRVPYSATGPDAPPDAPYFGIWVQDDQLRWHSPRLPAGASPIPDGLRSVDSRREIGARGPTGSRILVGRGTQMAERALAAFGRTVLLAGLGALAVALVGGFFLVSRVLRPIERMSEAASRISGSNLSARIDVAHTENELGRLALTLNDAFDRLEEAVERQARFTADASHELRTPLAVVRTNAEWALREDRESADYVESLAACQRAAARMGRTVEGLLALARAEADADPLPLEPVDLASIGRDTAALLEPLAREDGTRLRVYAEPAPTFGIAARLEIVVTTLLTNALQHGGEGGWVEMRAGWQEDSAFSFLAVSDDGPGIPADAVPHVFERFYRADPARSARRTGAGRGHLGASGGSGGNGLGLAIAKQIVEAHGGTIAVESTEGAGTTFTVRLPAARPLS